MELIISIAVGVLLIEVYAWLPKISEWLVECAASQLLAEDQARCREEWKASLGALPNSGLKLLHALSFFWAADRINADSMEAKLEQIGDQLEDLSDKHSRLLQAICSLKMTNAQRQLAQKNLEHFMGESVTSLRTIEVRASHDEKGPATKAIAGLVDAYEDYCRIRVVAFNRINILANSKVYKLSARTEQVDSRLRIMLVKHADATELLRNRKLSFSDLALILKNLDDDLQMSSVMTGADVEGGEDYVRDREFTRIMTILSSTARPLGGINLTQ